MLRTNALSQSHLRRILLLVLLCMGLLASLLLPSRSVHAAALTLYHLSRPQNVTLPGNQCPTAHQLQGQGDTMPIYSAGQQIATVSLWSDPTGCGEYWAVVSNTSNTPLNAEVCIEGYSPSTSHYGVSQCSGDVDATGGATSALIIGPGQRYPSPPWPIPTNSKTAFIGMAVVGADANNKQETTFMSCDSQHLNTCP